MKALDVVLRSLFFLHLLKTLYVILRVVVFPAATQNTPVFTNMLCSLDVISLDYYSLYLRIPY
jgi:hypothetical protein